MTTVLKPVTTTYLEMTEPNQLRPAARPPEFGPLQIMRAELPCGELNRFLYTAVGADWEWTDRLPWSLPQWQTYAESPGVETWVGYVRGTPAGYFELGYTETHSEHGADTIVYEVEIRYFGMLPAFTGKGLGGQLLTEAIRRAWEIDKRVSRVWVHTCTLDSPYALSNYKSRGMVVYKQVTE